ncbi:hypothetical protein FB446DRAFT_152211 [Lentinula raphanica]|nr:hypothetical protein FB446DRAFT_152211 [Lentinula raphanica]
MRLHLVCHGTRALSIAFLSIVYTASALLMYSVHSSVAARSYSQNAVRVQLPVMTEIHCRKLKAFPLIISELPMSGHWSPLLASGSSSSFAIPKHQISPHESSEPFKIYSNTQVGMRRKLGVSHDIPVHFLAGGAVLRWRTDEEKHESYILFDHFFFPKYKLRQCLHR